MKFDYSILLFLAPLACLADNQKGFRIYCTVRTLPCQQGRQFKWDSSDPI